MQYFQNVLLAPTSLQAALVNVSDVRGTLPRARDQGIVPARAGTSVPGQAARAWHFLAQPRTCERALSILRQFSSRGSGPESEMKPFIVCSVPSARKNPLACPA